MHKSLFGLVIKKLRQDLGLTQEMLASLSGLERTFISMLERGVKQPSLKTVSSLAHAMQLKSHELLHLMEAQMHHLTAKNGVTDVESEQKRLDALESEREKSRIGEIVNTIPIIFFARTPMPEYAMTFVSKNISQLFGYSKDHFMAHSGFWHAHIHEDDLPKVTARLQNMNAKDLLIHEYRFLTENAGWLKVREELKLVVSESGTPKEVIGSIVGVSAALLD
ncbi:MAG: PAS domain-containing protein [Methylotenera sp.]|jgi:transcriptional regulator with XRE-family HTH domain|nr:PAS domain-containing protein [Methylotenera sp.]